MSSLFKQKIAYSSLQLPSTLSFLFNQELSYSSLINFVFSFQSATFLFFSYKSPSTLCLLFLNRKLLILLFNYLPHFLLFLICIIRIFSSRPYQLPVTISSFSFETLILLSQRSCHLTLLPPVKKIKLTMDERIGTFREMGKMLGFFSNEQKKERLKIV